MPTRSFLVAAGRRALPSTLWLSAIITGTPCHATDDQAQAMALNCAACHTHTTAASAIPSLSGQTAEALRTRLLDYKYDRQRVSLMNRIAKAYSDAELTAIAAYLARYPRDAQP